MNRREFLRHAGIVGAVIGIGMASLPETIKNTVIYSSSDLEINELFYFDISYLERVIATETLFVSTQPQPLIRLHHYISKNLEKERIEYIEEMLVEKIINDSKKFSKEKPSGKDFRKATETIDEMFTELQRIRNETDIKFVNQKRNIFVVSKDESVEFGIDNLETFYSADNNYALVVSHVEEANYNSPLHRLSKTIKRISEDSEFMLNASKSSGVSLAKIVAFADIESQGRKFSVGRDGEINRFQLHPKHLNDIYRQALSVKNELSDYIREKTSGRNLLEDVARDSKLNMALAVNLMKYLEKRTEEGFESVLAYNRGLGKALGLSSRTKNKLRNPKNITEKDLKRYQIYKYYTNFLNAEKSFDEIRSYFLT
ncbi:MAG: transglycosylase SLT domain-containing protein [Candidatus Pacearchaeota archaeon]